MVSGREFERLVADRPSELNLRLQLKWIENQPGMYSKTPDVEFLDCPEIKIDCKYTGSYFEYGQRLSMLSNACEKYGENVVIVTGERKNKRRFNWDDVLVSWIDERLGLIMIRFDDWLMYYERMIYE